MWTHHKYKTAFKSSYERDRKGERIFVLTNPKTNRRITFESWQAASKLGWVRSK